MVGEYTTLLLIITIINLITLSFYSEDNTAANFCMVGFVIIFICIVCFVIMYNFAEDDKKDKKIIDFRKGEIYYYEKSFLGNSFYFSSHFNDSLKKYMKYIKKCKELVFTNDNIAKISYNCNCNYDINNMSFFNGNINCLSKTKLELIQFGDSFSRKINNLPKTLKKLILTGKKHGGDIFSCLPNKLRIFYTSFSKKNLKFLPNSLRYLHFNRLNDYRDKKNIIDVDGIIKCDVSSNLPNSLLTIEFSKEISENSFRNMCGITIKKPPLKFNFFDVKLTFSKNTKIKKIHFPLRDYVHEKK
jgi:hypothetical protein